MKIDTLEGVQLGGITQWIRVRGADASNPVLLLMQQGPGLPHIVGGVNVAWLLLFEEAPSDHARAGQLVRHDGAGRGQPWPDVRGRSGRWFHIAET